jgi:hypothetical protein
MKLSALTNSSFKLLNNNKNREIFDKENEYFKSDNILIVYQILFQLTKISEDNLQKNSDSFIDEFKIYFKENSIKGLGDLIKSLHNKCDFSDINVEKLKQIIIHHKMKELDCGLIGKLCKTTGLIAFFVKDALVFCGLDESQEKKNKEDKDKIRVLVIKDNIDIKEMKTKSDKILEILASVSKRYNFD